MKFGIFLLGERPPGLSDSEVFANSMELAQAADRLGFDEVWLAEHHFAPYGTFADPLTLAAAMARETERVRFGTAVLIPAFHNLVLLAERVAMVDVLSNGRFDLGLGRGYQQREFDAFDVPMAESNSRFMEAVAILRELLEKDRVSYAGQYTTIDDLAIHPRPVQSPVPIFIAAMRTPATFDWIAQEGYNALVGNPYVMDPEVVRGIELFHEGCAKVGRDPRSVDAWMLGNAFVAPTDEEARNYPRESTEIAMKYIAAYSEPFKKGQPVPADYAHYADWYDTQGFGMTAYDRMVDLTHSLIGSPETVRRKLGNVQRRYGWSNFMLHMNRGGTMSQAMVIQSMELFSKEVIEPSRELTA